MIYEFAIEPDLVATWGHPSEYRFFVDKFGLGTARIMSEFPKLKNWRRQLLRVATGAGDLELERITALIYILSEKMISRQNVQYDGSISWLKNAERENNRKKFHAILAASNPRNHADVLNGKNLGVNSENRWDLNSEKIIERKADKMAEAVLSMLSNCTMAIFIDPHFGPENARHRRTIKEFMQVLAQNRNNLPLNRVEIHTQEKSAEDFFKNECEDKMPKCIPTGVKVRFVRWKQKDSGEKLHNRFILTDIGGVKFGVGLDDGRSGETDEVSLLTKETYELRWSQYVSDNPAFDLVDEVFVSGIKSKPSP